jgi:glycosyltransferase involved in cell wall biosynthesis
MRVVHVSASFPRHEADTTAPFLLDLVAAQRHAGIDASVVALHDAGLPTRHEVAGVPVRRARYGREDWEVLAYRGSGHGALRHPAHAALLPGVVASMAVALGAEVRSRRPDVVHAHWILPNALVAALVPGRHRLVLTLHGNDVALAASRLAQPVARLVARRADVLLAVSEGLARQAEEVLDLPAGAVGVTHLPLPAGLEPTALPPGPPRFLAAGRASYEKGFDVLLDALARPEGAAWSGTLLAEGPELPELRRRVAGLDGRVELLPLQPRAALFDLVRAHHVVVVPSRREGLGFTALEALALGRPVVASRVGGLPEVVADGVDGALVRPDDPADLAGALARLLEPDALHVPRAARVAAHRPEAVVAAHRVAYAGGRQP